MKIYLVDSGKFPMIVMSELKRFYLMDTLELKLNYLRAFFSEHLELDTFKESFWFEYTKEEIESIKYKDNRVLSENDLIGFFSLKKHYQSGIIAVRDTDKSKASVFKKDQFLEYLEGLPDEAKEEIMKLAAIPNPSVRPEPITTKSIR